MSGEAHCPTYTKAYAIEGVLYSALQNKAPIRQSPFFSMLLERNY